MIFFNVYLAVFTVGSTYQKHDYWKRYPELKKMYYDSIYANKKGGFIPDEFVYSFAAGSLLKGVSPILVNPETPPLGKYLIGLSIIIFNNEHILTLFFGIASLFILYFIGKQVFSSSLLALLPVTLLSFEPLFLNQLKITPLLDIVQLFFLLCFFLFFNIAHEKTKYLRYFILANCMLGGFISVKYFGVGVTVFGAAIVVLLLRKEFKQIIYYVITSIIAPIILLAMYIQVLFSGYTLSAFLGIQKWIFFYNQGHVTKPFTFFPLFLINRWYAWWNDSILSDSEWQMTWPLSFVLLAFVLWTYYRYSSYRNKALDIVLVWVVIYIGLLQIGYVSARYFVILLPPLFIVMVYGLRSAAMLYLKSKK
jgi:hypothetical protein